MFNGPSFFSYSLSDTEDPRKQSYILLHPTRPRWVAVNRTALELANCLDRGESFDEAAACLVARYGVAFETAKRDTLQVAEELARQGFLLGDYSDTSIRTPSLASVFFHITSRCNLSCAHCYLAGWADGDLPASLILRILDEMRKQGSEGVTFSGGEPLLHPDLKTILDHAAGSLKVRLLTNGTLIDREWADFLAETVSSVQISVDGSTSGVHDAIRGKGTFEKALRAVECLQDAGLSERITLATTVMKQNLGDLPAIIHLAERLGVATLRFLPLRLSGRAKAQWELVGSGLRIEDYEEFYRYVFSLRESRPYSVAVSCGLSGFLLKLDEGGTGDECWCTVGKKLVIDARGDIYPCVLLMGGEFRLGNAFRQSLVKVIGSERLGGLCNTVSRRRAELAQCRGCLWRNLCQAGCMGQAWEQRGTVWDTDEFCSYRKKAYQNAFDKILQSV